MKRREECRNRERYGRVSRGKRRRRRKADQGLALGRAGAVECLLEPARDQIRERADQEYVERRRRKPTSRAAVDDSADRREHAALHPPCGSENEDGGERAP